VLALSTVAPDAKFLLPEPVKRFHRAVLSLVGVTDGQIIPWDGASFASDRILVLESDGRIGGGRPLSSLMQLRRIVAPPASVPRARRDRRIYVSRRDAVAKGAWVSNEPDVEAVFRSRGFEILVMSDCPLDDQLRIFREAAVVAGVSGAGLTDIVFSPPGTHVIVLLSDSLIRWYAHPGRARSKWAAGTPARKEPLAALGDSPRFYAHLAAACEQYCHSFVSGDRVPLGELAAFLDEALDRAGSR
jgi:capsular polysaccharide biosynthesis protein